MKLFALSTILILTGCHDPKIKVNFEHGTKFLSTLSSAEVSMTQALTLDQTAEQAVVTQGNEEAFLLKGLCNDRQINSIAQPLQKIIECKEGSFETTLDLSGLDDGQITIELASALSPTHTPRTTEYSLLKDTTATGVTATVMTNSSVSVDGDDLQSYRFKFASEAACDPDDIQSDPREKTQLIEVKATSHKFLCVLGYDEHGNRSEVIIKDLSDQISQLIIAQSINSSSKVDPLPALASNTRNLAITVKGKDIVAYRYKIGTTACSNKEGYSTERKPEKTINDDISTMADGKKILCIISKNKAGVWQDFKNAITQTWTKDTTPPTATVTGQPTVSSNAANLDLTVAGDDVTHYRYRIGTTATDCTVDTGYSTETPIATKITQSLSSQADGVVKVCVIGRDANNNWQATTDVSTVKFTRDTTAPNTPTVTGTTPTTDTTPTWTFTSGGGSGNGTFRYKLDSSDFTSGSTETTGNTYTSTDVIGSHTLYVQERDVAGNWSSTGSFTIETQLVLTKLYPLNGSNWNDWVKNTDTTKDEYHQTDTACAGTETGVVKACVHGGEKLKVVLTGQTSCTNLTGTDDLGVFQWTCDSTTSPVQFYTSGFQTGKGLGDLITGTSWRNLTFTVKNSGTTLAQSASTALWTNTITALTDNSGGSDSAIVLTTQSTVYILSASRASQGYLINADKIAIVTLPGVTMTYGGQTTSNSLSSGEAGAGGFFNLVGAGSQKYLWIEGSYNHDTAGQDAISRFRTVTYSRFHNLTITKSTAGLELYSSNYNIASQITIEGGIGLKMRWGTSSYNYFENVTVNNSTDHGLELYGSYNRFNALHINTTTNTAIDINTADYNKLYNVNIYNTTTTASANGITIGNSTTGNTLQKIKISSASYRGIVESGNGDNIWSDLTIIGHGNYPIVAQKKATYHGVTSLNGGQILLSDPNQTINNLAAPNSLRITISDGSKILSNIAAPDVRTSADATSINVYNGLIAESCTRASGDSTGPASTTCANGTGSTATVAQTAITSSFMGKVTTDDTTNAHDTNGLAAYSSITDGNNFQYEYRGYGVEGSAYPNADNRGRCSTGNSRIWDARLKASDTILRNRSGDITNGNGTFTAGATCPAAVHGSRTLTDLLTTPNTFLVSAYEIWGDRIGDDDGLCESNEACIYQPNIGSYAGEGDYSSNTCTFVNGTVTGVTMYAYPTNGGS